MRRLIAALLASVFQPGCSGLLAFSDSPRPPTRAELELQRPTYNGRDLSGRLLVGVREGRLMLDRRFSEGASVSVASVLDCATGQPTAYLLADTLAQPPASEHLLTLGPGQWYGVDLRLALFDEVLTGSPGPACVALPGADDEPVGRVRLRLGEPAREAVGCKHQVHRLTLMP